MENLIVKLYQSSKTVLTTKDLALLWGENNMDSLKAKLSYYVKKGALIRLSRGIFAKNKEYNPLELATSIYTPAYISFETALREEGVIFQHYNTIYVAGRRSKTVVIGSRTFTYRKLKNEVLFNPTGVIDKGNYAIAGPERAFLDMLYLFPSFYFDNLRTIDWEACSTLVLIYNNEKLVKRFNEYRKKYA